MCKWDCDNDCTTYGQHLRNKGLSFPGVFSTRSKGAGRGDATAQKKWDNELQAYRDARSQGIQPAGTNSKAIDRAVRMSDKAGRAYDAGTGSFTDGV